LTTYLHFVFFNGLVYPKSLIVVIAHTKFSFKKQ